MTDPVQVKVRGTVKWFSDEKGFGFLMCEGVGVDVFVHKQQLQKSGVDDIKEGDRITCVVNKGIKGMYATLIAKD
jgi:CspA family cold shock protein